MVERCNAAGVNVIADLVTNHMSAGFTGTGSAGSGFDGNSQVIKKKKNQTQRYLCYLSFCTISSVTASKLFI